MRAGPLVVLGDSLLDRDWTGLATRLAPDAPVPVVEVDQVWLRPGGAALTALLAARAGSPVVLLTALGDDDAGRTIARLLADHLDVVSVPLLGRTVTKARVSASGHPMVRLDRGNGVAAPQSLPDLARRALTGAGAVIVSDYGRGMSALPGLARDLGPNRATLLWDPHPRGAPIPPGCGLVTPNLREASVLAGTNDPAEVRRRWKVAAVALTCGADGARLADEHGVEHVQVPAELRSPGTRADACGAGDQLAASAGEVLRTGGTVREATAAGVAAAARYVLDGGAGAVSTLEAGLADETFLINPPLTLHSTTT